MTRRNIEDTTREKPRKFHWPTWFPYPSCWLKSLLLMMLLRVVMFVAENLGRIGYSVAKFASSPELLAIFAIITFLSPIPLLAFTHHFLHLILGRFIREIQAPEIGVVQGVVPKLMSWWEGLYGWLVIILSTSLASLFCTLILPIFQLNYQKSPIYYTPYEQNIIVIFAIIWFINGALIYQIDYLVRNHLISVYSKNVNP